MPTPTYIDQAYLETRLGGPQSLALIADPTFAAQITDAAIVEAAIVWAEGEVLRYCRGVPQSGVGEWENTPALIPTPLKEHMADLAVYGIHERIRAAQGYEIPKASIENKKWVYAELEKMQRGETTYTQAGAAKHRTQKVKIVKESDQRVTSSIRFLVH